MKVQVNFLKINSIIERILCSWFGVTTTTYTTELGPKYTLVPLLLSSEKTNTSLKLKSNLEHTPAFANICIYNKDSRNQKAAWFLLGKPTNVQFKTLSNHQLTTCYASNYHNLTEALWVLNYRTKTSHIKGLIRVKAVTQNMSSSHTQGLDDLEWETFGRIPFRWLHWWKTTTSVEWIQCVHEMELHYKYSSNFFPNSVMPHYLARHPIGQCRERCVISPFQNSRIPEFVQNFDAVFTW